MKRIRLFLVETIQLDWSNLITLFHIFLIFFVIYNPKKCMEGSRAWSLRRVSPDWGKYWQFLVQTVAQRDNVVITGTLNNFIFPFVTTRDIYDIASKSRIKLRHGFSLCSLQVHSTISKHVQQTCCHTKEERRGRRVGCHQILFHKKRFSGEVLHIFPLVFFIENFPADLI